MPTTWVEGGSEGFGSWLAAREPALHRLATLLTGDPWAGHSLLTPVLAQLCLHWTRIGSADAEHHARELLLSEHRRTWDRRASEAARIRLTEEYDGADAAAWALVGSLPARERAIVVVRHHEQLDAAETGRLLRLTAGLVQAEDTEVLTALRLQLDRQRVSHRARAVPNDPAELLAETLRAHAEDTAYVPSDLDDVRADAAGLRSRRRRTTALVVVAAVAVVALLIPLVDPLPSAPAPAPAPAGPRQEASRQTGRPDVAYLIDNVYVARDGTRTELPVERPGSVLPFRGGFLVADLDLGARTTLRWIAGDNRLVERRRWLTSGFPVASRDGRVTAWVTRQEREPTTSVIRRGRDRQVVPGSVSLVGMVGTAGEKVVFNAPEPAGAWITDLAGPARPIAGLGSVLAVEPRSGVVAGRALGSGDGVVLDLTTGTQVWRSPRWRPESFSPDGRLVAAVSSPEPARLGILDAASGRLLHSVDGIGAGPAEPFVLDLVWEDNKSLLVLASHYGSSTILRVGAGGTLTQATSSLPADFAGGSRWRFATH
ncbi:MAG: hypothetical protein ABIQ15_13035 [Nocardioides sp.]